MSFAVSWVYVLAATVASIAIGMLWYSPLMFAKPWLAAMGLKKTDIGDAGVSPTPGYLASTVCTIGQAYGLGLLVRNLPVSGIGGALAVATAVWLVTSGLANLRLKYFEDRPWKLYLIDEGATLLGYLVMAVLTTLWL